MNAIRPRDGIEPRDRPRRGGVHRIADVVEEFMEHYAARFPEAAVAPAEEEAVAV